MPEEKSVELRVSVDVGYRRHSVAMGLSSGEVLEEFEIEHRLEGFEDFFSRIEKHSHPQGYSVSVAMEGYNGHARPLDSMVRQRGYRLYNIQQSEVGTLQGDLSRSSQERPDRCAQGVGTVSAKRSPAPGQRSPTRSFGDTTPERSAQAVNPASAPLGQRAGAGG